MRNRFIRIYFLCLLLLCVYSFPASAQLYTEPEPDSVRWNYCDFIAWVTILDTQWDTSGPVYYDSRIAHVRINELFKGQKTDTLLYYYAGLCGGMQIGVGEEWLVYGEIKGDDKMSVYGEQYRDTSGLRPWKYGLAIEELNKLRTYYHHPQEEHQTGTFSTFYKNRKTETRTSYVDGKLNGERRVWYPNGVLLSSQYYVNDTLHGKSVWYYPSGQLEKDEFYIKGKRSGIFKRYFDTTLSVSQKEELLVNKVYASERELVKEYSRIQVKEEFIYDRNGELLVEKTYKRNGNPDVERIYDPTSNYAVVIYYQSNQLISRISFDASEYYQDFDTIGMPARLWKDDLEIDKQNKKHDDSILMQKAIPLDLPAINDNSAVISAAKMNVVYIGIQNELEIAVPGVAQENLWVVSSEGTLTQGEKTGQYFLTFPEEKTREVRVTVFVKEKDGNLKEKGIKEFRVRNIPVPTIMLGAIDRSGLYNKGQLRSAMFLYTALKDFAYEGVTYTPVEYTITRYPIKGGEATSVKGTGPRLTKEMQKLFKRARLGDKFVVLDVKATGPAGLVELKDKLIIEIM